MAENNDIRLAVVELEVKTVKDKLNEMHTEAKEHREATLDIKDKLTKFNGTVYHLADDIREIKEALNGHIKDESVDIKQLAIKLNKPDSITKFKVNVIWGILGTTGIAVLGVLIKLVFG